MVADIEGYPRFVPGWRYAKIRQRDDNQLVVDQEIGLGPLRAMFSSVAQLHPPGAIHITATDKLLPRLEIHWVFAPGANGMCQATFQIGFALRHRVLQTLANVRLPETARSVVAAFDQRAVQLYGARHIDPG